MKHKDFFLSTSKYLFSLALLCPAVPTTTYAQTISPSCYKNIAVQAPPQAIQSHLYIFIDHTSPVSERMAESIQSLVADRIRAGETIKIARLAPMVKGLYSELIFNANMDVEPGEYLLYNLRSADRESLMECLEKRGQEFREHFNSVLKNALKSTDPSIPRTDLLYSLKNLSEQIISKDETTSKTVLLVSDGLENTDSISFYQNNNIKPMLPRRELAKVKRKRLVADWKNADIYMVGVGQLKDSNQYVKPRYLNYLESFWKIYFSAGSGNVKGIGTPMLFINTI